MNKKTNVMRFVLVIAAVPLGGRSWADGESDPQQQIEFAYCDPGELDWTDTFYGGYLVTGSLATLNAQFHQPFAADTVVSIELSYKFSTEGYWIGDQHTINCYATSKATDLKWTATYDETFPEWDDNDYDNATPTQQEEWGRFIAAVGVHEQIHIDITNDYLQQLMWGEDPGVTDPNIEECISAAGGNGPREAADAAEDMLGGEIEPYAQAAQDYFIEIQNAYDFVTTHGATQGAVLDGSVQ